MKRMRRGSIVFPSLLLCALTTACGRSGSEAGGDDGDRATIDAFAATKVRCTRTDAAVTESVNIGPGTGDVRLESMVGGTRVLVATLHVPAGAVTRETSFTLQMPSTERALVYASATQGGVDFKGPFRRPLLLTIHYAGRNCTVGGTPIGEAADLSAYKTTGTDGGANPGLLRREGGANVPELNEFQFLISTFSGYIIAQG